jgi:hypothetical protein
MFLKICRFEPSKKLRIALIGALQAIVAHTKRNGDAAAGNSANRSKKYLAILDFSAERDQSTETGEGCVPLSKFATKEVVASASLCAGERRVPHHFLR